MEVSDITECATSHRHKSESEYLLGIFPREIWDKILEEIQDYNYLENISNSSSFFHHLLKSKRVHFLFPKVWEILDLKYHQTQFSGLNPTANEDGDYHLDGIPFKCCSSCEGWKVEWWYSTTLNLRLVCKSWSKSIDKFHQDLMGGYDSNNEDDIRKPNSCTARSTQVTFWDNNLERIEKFLWHFKTTHLENEERCPFISRRVDISLIHGYNLEEQQHISDEFSRVLKKYGRHVWSTSMFVALKPAHYHNELREILELMPNLKLLNVNYLGGEEYDLSVENIEQLDFEINQNPLPKLESLQMLVVQELPAPLFNELIRSNDHIEFLGINGGFKYEDYDFQTNPLSNLKVFSLQLDTIDEFRKIIDPQVLCNLEKLRLDFYGNEYNIEWADIFLGLEGKWAETLTSLKITLPTVNEDQENFAETCSSLSLGLPHLVYLKVDINNLSCLDFIIPMKESLEFLEIIIYCCDENERRKERLMGYLETIQTVQVINYSDRLLESNIWEMFPKLKKVVFEYGEDAKNKVISEYTRTEWKYKTKGIQ